MRKLTSDQQIITGEAGHKYSHQMLNMAEDDLDPFQYRLLAHYVRWVGQGGAQQETIAETAAATRMSAKKVRSARAELIERGYLYVYEPTLEERGEGIPAIVEVRDRWLENAERYADKEPEANMPEVTHLAQDNMPEPPEANMPLKYLKDSKYLKDKEKDKDKRNATGLASQPVEVGHEVKKHAPPKRSDVFETLALESFGIADPSALDKTTVILINTLESWLKTNSSGATVETLKAFYAWYDKHSSGAARPRNVAKFGVHFIAFRQQHLVLRKTPPEVVNSGLKIVPAETDWRREPAGVGK